MKRLGATRLPPAHVHLRCNNPHTKGVSRQYLRDAPLKQGLCDTMIVEVLRDIIMGVSRLGPLSSNLSGDVQCHMTLEFLSCFFLLFSLPFGQCNPPNPWKRRQECPPKRQGRSCKREKNKKEIPKSKERGSREGIAPQGPSLY